MDKETLLEHYRMMVYLRRFDLQCAQLKSKDIIYSGYHPTIGQEAIAAGFIPALNDDDVVFSTHRPHTHAAAKNIPLPRILGEMMGRTCGCSGGLGGAMQFLDTEYHFYCGSIVGSNIPIAAGVGTALKQGDSDRICLCLFGDGATNTGAFHEGMNLAAIWKLPVIFLCENNQYAEAMPVKEFVSAPRIADRAISYGLEPWQIDGNDVVAVAQAAEEAIKKVRSGEGPVFIEAMTYRIKGHYVGDPEHTYRDKKEVEEWKKKSPLIRAKAILAEMGVSDEEFKQINKDVNAQLAEAEEYCLAQPCPTFEESIAHVEIPLMETVGEMN